MKELLAGFQEVCDDFKRALGISIWKKVYYGQEDLDPNNKVTEQQKAEKQIDGFSLKEDITHCYFCNVEYRFEEYSTIEFPISFSVLVQASPPGSKLPNKTRTDYKTGTFGGRRFLVCPNCGGVRCLRLKDEKAAWIEVHADAYKQYLANRQKYLDREGSQFVYGDYRAEKYLILKPLRDHDDVHQRDMYGVEADDYNSSPWTTRATTVQVSWNYWQMK